MKLVLMKYLNSHSLPCYRRITEETAPGSDEYRLEMMKLEAEEMLYSGDMKEKLWIKCLDDEQHKQLIKDEAEARMNALEKLDRAWTNA